jgi:hypothetical protein
MFAGKAGAYPSEGRLLASTHSNFFRGQIDRGQFYWPRHSGETRLSQEVSVGGFRGPRGASLPPRIT